MRRPTKRRHTSRTNGSISVLTHLTSLSSLAPVHAPCATQVQQMEGGHRFGTGQDVGGLGPPGDLGEPGVSSVEHRHSDTGNVTDSASTSSVV